MVVNFERESFLHKRKEKKPGTRISPLLVKMGIVFAPMVSRRLLVGPCGVHHGNDCRQFTSIQLLHAAAVLVDLVGQRGGVHPDTLSAVDGEPGHGLADVAATDTTAGDDLQAAGGGAVADCVELLEVLVAVSQTARGQDAVEAAADEDVDALCPALAGGDGVEGAVEDAGKGAGGVDEEFAALLVDGVLEVWVLYESGGLGLALEDAEDEAVAADGVEDSGGLEVVDGLQHESNLVVGVDEVLEQVVLLFFSLFLLLLVLLLVLSHL